MSRTLSTMLDLGTSAPDFLLADTQGKTIKPGDFSGEPLLVVFMCNHCPYVIHIRDKFSSVSKNYLEQGVAVVAINSNDVATHPADAPDKMAAEVANMNYSFPYLYDASQAVAKAYRAACTPDFFLFDTQHKLVYRGQFDASRPGNKEPVTGDDLGRAVTQLLQGKTIPEAEQKPSMGCNIKWKLGNEPDYFGS